MLTDKITILIVTMTIIAVALALKKVRHELMQHRRERGYYHKLRHGLLAEEGVEVRIPTGVYSWQSCDESDRDPALMA